MHDQDDEDDARRDREDDEAERHEDDDAGGPFKEGDESGGGPPRGEAALEHVLRTCVKGFILEPASSIPARPVEWLWQGRVPCGHVTLLAGDPDVGKSLVALDLAARVSSGALWPDESAEDGGAPPPDAKSSGTADEGGVTAVPLSAPGDKPGPAVAPYEPANVLILTTHENPQTTLRPRLEQAGADLRRIFFANGMPRNQEGDGLTWRRQIRLPDDILSLAKALVELKPVDLVILDPAWAYCNRGRGRSRLAGPAQLTDLADLATQFQVAIVCVTELRRVNRGKAAYQVAGSKALTAVARAGWGVLRHPREPNRRVLLPLKMNLGPPASGLEFCIHERGISWESAPAKVTAEAVFAAERAGTELEGAEQWLRTYLSNGSRPSKEVLEQAKECGFSAKTLQRAKLAIRVKSSRVEFEKGKSYWYWSLEGQEPVGENEIARLHAAG